MALGSIASARLAPAAASWTIPPSDAGSFRRKCVSSCIGLLFAGPVEGIHMKLDGLRGFILAAMPWAPRPRAMPASWPFDDQGNRKDSPESGDDLLGSISPRSMSPAALRPLRAIIFLRFSP